MSSFITAGFQVLQGVETFQAAKTEEKALRRQGGLAVQESEREAERQQEANERFEQRQRLSFLKAGVRLEGTPLQVLAETQEKGTEEVEAVRERGIAEGGLLRSRAQVTRRGGRSALLGSLATASFSAKQGFTESTGGVFSRGQK